MRRLLLASGASSSERWGEVLVVKVLVQQRQRSGFGSQNSQKESSSWWLALVISVLERQRQMDPWSSLVSQSSLACLVSSGPERDLVKRKKKKKRKA